METSIEKNGREINVKPHGRIDSSTAGEFEEQLLAAIDENTSEINIDMSEVDFISSKGIRALVAAYRKIGERELTLNSVNQSVREVIRISGLLEFFTVTEG